ncbi:MAG: hypothetical protein AAF433_03585 [Bacteroidota bacterium]
MKRLINGLLTLFIAFMFCGCNSSAETFHLEANGRGRIESLKDLSNSWPMLQMTFMSQMQQLENEDPAPSFLLDLFAQSSFDTTVSFVEVFSALGVASGEEPIDAMGFIDKFSGDPETEGASAEVNNTLLGLLVSTDLRFQGDSESSTYSMTSIQYFSDLEELAALEQDLNNISEMELDTSIEDVAMMTDVVSGVLGGSPIYRLEGDILYVSRPPQAELDAGMGPDAVMAMQAMSGATQDYSLNLQLPGRIKSVSRDAEINKRAGTVEVTIPAAEVENGFAFEVIFKARR